MSQKSQTIETRRRRIVFGPGVITAIVIVVALIAMGKIPLMQHPKPELGPRMALTPEERLGPTPNVDYLLKNSSALHLTSAQSAHIKQISDQSRAQLAPLEDKLNKEAGRLGAWLNSHQTKGVGPADVSRNSSNFGSLSHLVSQLRYQYWEEANKVLSTNQRRQVGMVRQKDWQRTLGKLRIPGDENK